MTGPYDDFYGRIGYRFADESLLERALTHSSFPKSRLESNQRLEFLGDRVLGLAMASILFDAYGGEDEGGLAVRHASLVSAPALFKIADNVGLSSLIRMSRQEAARGGAKSRNIMADALEAVLGAAFLDGGFGAACNIVERLWRSRLSEGKDDLKDFKSRLQEYSQKAYGAKPEYVMMERSGPDHEPSFTMSVRVDTASEIATAGSRKEAERLAAEKLLAKLEG